jgi:UDP-glucose 4-epimerase
MNNIIIIGNSGYIGGALTKYLLTLGTYNIIAPSSRDCNFLNLEEVKSFFSALDYKNYHVVFTAVINKSKNDSIETFLQNVKIVSNFIEGQRKAKISSIIFLSSIDIYGREPNLPITEETKINPDNWYGLSKFVSEWILTLSGQIECPLTILRLPGIFGKSQKDNSVIGKLIHNIEDYGKIILHGNGEVLRDYIYIKDVVRIIEIFILKSNPGIFNLATGKNYFIKDIVEIIRDTLPDFDIVYEQADNCRMFDLFFDNNKLKNVLADFQFSNIETGLSSYFIEP